VQGWSLRHALEQGPCRLARRVGRAHVAGTASQLIEPDDVPSIEVDQRGESELSSATETDAEHGRRGDESDAPGARIAVANEDEHRVVGVVVLAQPLYGLAQGPVEFALLGWQGDDGSMDENGGADGAGELRELAHFREVFRIDLALVIVGEEGAAYLSLGLESFGEVLPCGTRPISPWLLQTRRGQLRQLDIRGHQNNTRLSDRFVEGGDLGAAARLASGKSDKRDEDHNDSATTTHSAPRER